MILASLILALGASPGRPILGQEAPVLRADQRIRITATELGYYNLTGRLLDVGADGLRMRGVNLPYEVNVPLSLLDRFEVSRGKNRLFTAGAPALGLVLGAALGPVLLTEDPRCLVVGDADPDCIKETPDAVVGAVTGFGLFGIAAQILTPERWAVVPITTLARWSPQEGGLHLGLGVRF